MLYEMLTGLPPFYDENTNEMYRKILQEPLTFPSSDIVPPAARDLLTRLLDRDPQRRLGANGAVEIKSHHFFANIDWRKLLQRKYEPSFRPNVVCRDFSHPFILISLILIHTRFYSWMLVILITLIASSPRRPHKTPMLTVLRCHRLCNSSLPAGPITDPWPDSATAAVVLRTRPSAASRSKGQIYAGLHTRTIIRSRQTSVRKQVHRHDSSFVLSHTFGLDPHITHPS